MREGTEGDGAAAGLLPSDAGDAVVLPADPASIRAARRHLTARCRLHAVPGDLADEAALMTSELATNAVLHGRSTITVKVCVVGPLLRVEIDDDNTRRPQLRAQDPAALDGRGLHIVDALASRWGVADRPIGKSVWFEMVLPA